MSLLHVFRRRDTATKGRVRRGFIVAGGVLAATIATAAWVVDDPADAGSSHTAGAAHGETPLPAATLSVETVAPQSATITRTLAASGSLHARDELLIGSDASGVRLLDVTVDVGSRVKRGQLLARGDDATLLAQLAQQQAQVRDRKAELAQARANLQRADSVHGSGVYSDETHEARRHAAESAHAKLDLALAQQREIELRIAQTQVHAPADGVIVKKSATVGAVMQPGLELFRMMRGDEIEWRAELPDQLLGGIGPGSTARVMLGHGRSVEGRVRLVAPTVDARTRNGLVFVSLPEAGALRAGGHAQGEIRVGSVQALTLPESVVLMKDGQSFVYVIGEQGIARATRIVTGARQDGRIEVQGLDPAARVVASGAGFVKDGERVRIATPLAAHTQTERGARS